MVAFWRAAAGRAALDLEYFRRGLDGVFDGLDEMPVLVPSPAAADSGRRRPFFSGVAWCGRTCSLASWPLLWFFRSPASGIPFRSLLLWTSFRLPLSRLAFCSLGDDAARTVAASVPAGGPAHRRLGDR